MMNRFREERGMAMVVSLLVVFVVLILSTYVIDQAIHNTTQSAKSRDRVLAVDASEAGLDWFYNYLQTTQIDELAVTSYSTADTAKIEDLGTAPTTARFTVHANYYDAAGAVMNPSTFTETVYPASVYIRSVGSVNGEQDRTMETYVKLTPVYGGFGAAIITNNSLNLSNNLTLNGFTTNDADIIINSGNLTISNQPNIFGSVYVVNGSATLGGNSNIRQNLWANAAVTINNPSVVTGNATSSTSSISGSGSIGGNATAGTTISGVSVAGTRTQNTIQGPPPSQPLPQIPWVQADWTNAALTAPDLPYQVVTFTNCTTAATYLTTGMLTPLAGYGGIVVRIAAVCNVSIANNRNITFNGNLAIVTDGSLTIVNRSTWTGSGSKRKLYLIDAYRSGLNCASGLYNISASNNTNFVNTDVFAYSPCTVNWANQNAVSGQVLGGTVNINNQFTMNYVPVKVPGAGEITGFNEDIAYIREVKN